MTLKQTAAAWQRYRDELEGHLTYDEEHPMEAYSQPTHSAIHCLVSSDEITEHDKSPEAYLRRYEFRDGAAQMLCHVFGLDMGQCRNLMRTNSAYYDYLEVKEAAA